jgi:hypothetical protein
MEAVVRGRFKICTQIAIFASAVLLCSASFADIAAGTSTLTLSDQTLIEPTPQSTSPTSLNEIYSESGFLSHTAEITTSSRLRYLQSLGLSHLNAYAGVLLERDFNPAADGPALENAFSPMLGISYQAFDALMLWAEYRERISESHLNVSNQSSESDPRFGISIGKALRGVRSRRGGDLLEVEGYGEIVVVPRLSGKPVSSAYLRSSFGPRFAGLARLALYSEINQFLSPQDAFGKTRTDLRGGLLAQIEWLRWQGSLSAYHPWVLSEKNADRSAIEALLVIGGTF